MIAAAGMLQLAEGLGFNLPDTLTRYPKNLADFFQSMRCFIPETKAHTQNAFLLWA